MAPAAGRLFNTVSSSLLLVVLICMNLAAMSVLQVRVVHGRTPTINTPPGLSQEEEEDAEIEQQLKLINKPALKTFKMDYGDIVDCVDIYKQPALDHPLLKNHKIRTKPSRVLPSIARDDYSNPRASRWPNKENNMLSGFGWPKNEECPPGSIPIRRTTREDLLRAKALNVNQVITNTTSTVNGIQSTAIPGTLTVGLTMHQDHPATYVSAEALFSIWNFPVDGSQSSATQLWVENASKQISLQTGWIISPQLYGDSGTRFFVYWTVDGSATTGCYDLRCAGFVQTGKGVFFGEKLRTSVYSQRVAFTLRIYQDATTKDWWVYNPFHDVHIGYWPSALLPSLADGVESVTWGGRVTGNPDGTFPPMGSGSFSKPEDYNLTCHFAEMEYDDKSAIHAPKMSTVQKIVEGSSCYGLEYFPDSVSGSSFSFGGPGGKCGS